MLVSGLSSNLELRVIGKTFIKIGLLLVLVVLGHLLTQRVLDSLGFELTPANEPAVHRMIMLSMVAYVLLMAIPFIPGAEIGLAVMVLLGPKIAPLVYACTVLSLMLSFVIGRFVPERVLIRIVHALRLRRAAAMLDSLQGTDTSERLELMMRKARWGLLPPLLKYRYAALLVAINTPGNILIGGGGGIAMFAGMCRLFGPVKFLLTVMLAVAPVPVLLMGYEHAFLRWLD